MLKVLLIGIGEAGTARTLKLLGCQVIEFPDAVMAFKVLRLGNPFDIIFVDQPDGIEVLKQIKALYPAVPVVLTCSNPTPDCEAEARASGAVEYFSGTVSFDKYRAVVSAALPA